MKEVHRMLTPRWLARLTIPIVAGAALVSSVAVANADPRDDAYLNQLRGAGLTWPDGHEQALIGTAWLICDDLGWGWTPQQIANNIHANLDPDDIHVHDVGAMVNTAKQIYCPNQRCWAPHC
jgi:thiamine pyrophosphate-dependent acetolactate synthase large subunit-like protein